MSVRTGESGLNAAQKILFIIVILQQYFVKLSINDIFVIPFFKLNIYINLKKGSFRVKIEWEALLFFPQLL